MSDLPEYILDRQFEAPRDMVWKAWTDPTLLKRWYGPGVETVIHEFDLTPGGVWLNEMRWGGNSHYQKVIFQEISEPEKMVWHHHSSTDSNWTPTVNPMMADWPHLLLTTVTFEDQGERTNVRLSQIPMNASNAEIACFAEKMAGMGQGWGGGYAIIDEILSELQA